MTQLTQVSGTYPPPVALGGGARRWGPGGTVASTATPWLNAAFPFVRAPAIGEEWTPGVLAVEYAFNVAPGAEVIAILYQNAIILPGSSADPGGTPLATIVLPNTAVPGVVVENVAQPMGNLKAGDTLALVLTQPGAPAWTLDFKASVQGNASRLYATPRRVLT